MLPVFIALLIAVFALAWANGANDVAKGVATLAGSGVAGARRAILWGAVMSTLGGIAGIVWGASMLKVFSGGLLTDGVFTPLSFTVGAVTGAAGWVLIATRLRLPVSTTHGLVGGIVGAGIATIGAGGVRFGAVGSKAFLPLLSSPLVAIALCAILLAFTRWLERRKPQWTPGCCDYAEYQANPYHCAPEGERPSPTVMRVWTVLHWFSAGAVSFARGLNDVPKMAAIALPVLILMPALGGMGQGALIAGVALVMGLGSLWGGYRILPVLAEGVTRMDVRTGLVANLGTSALVLLASPLGLPVSTTHVATGSLFGVRAAEGRKPRAADALKPILLGWVVTFPSAAAIAGAVALATHAAFHL